MVDCLKSSHEAKPHRPALPTGAVIYEIRERVLMLRIHPSRVGTEARDVREVQYVGSVLAVIHSMPSSSGSGTTHERTS
jgi:hypothetical protein